MAGRYPSTGPSIKNFVCYVLLLGLWLSSPPVDWDHIQIWGCFFLNYLSNYLAYISGVKHVACWTYVVMWLAVLAKSPPCSSSDTNSAGSSSWHQVPLKASSSDSSSAAASVVFCNSSSVPVTPSSDTQVLPVYLLQPGAVSVPVPLLYGGPCVRPAAIASQSLPIMHSPWLAASPAGMQVSTLSKHQSVSTYL